MQQYGSFYNVFQSDNIHVPYCKFKHFLEITKPIQPSDKKHPTKKVEFLEIFSSKNGYYLKEKKTKHSLTDGKGCLNNKKLRITFAMWHAYKKLRKTKQTVRDLNKDYRRNYHTVDSL